LISAGGGCCSCTGSVPPLYGSSPNDEDVATEESLVRQQVTENKMDPNVAVQVRGLIKTFPGIRSMVGCCKCRKTAPYHAVKVHNTQEWHWIFFTYFLLPYMTEQHRIED
jgi:hypothetical protein